jgi:hypothetical protein
LEIVSGTSILIGSTGVINMGGGALKINYGSGGGSGGAILLEAPSVTVRGVLAANGGGGTATNAGEAQDGLAGDQPAMGSSQDATRRAGNGGAGMLANGGKAEPPLAGLSSGGGGGGVGRIRINTGCGGMATVAMSAVISPAESTGCYTKGMLLQ